MHLSSDTSEKATSHQVMRAPPKTYNKSTFQGSITSVSSQDDILPALFAIYRDSSIASATHNIYAVHYNTPQGVTEYFQDDGEFGAGRRILNKLQEINSKNTLVCVSRWHSGPNLGQSRFAHIDEAAQNVLDMFNQKVNR